MLGMHLPGRLCVATRGLSPSFAVLWMSISSCRTLRLALNYPSVRLMVKQLGHAKHDPPPPPFPHAMNPLCLHLPVPRSSPRRHAEPLLKLTPPGRGGDPVPREHAPGAPRQLGGEARRLLGRQATEVLFGGDLTVGLPGEKLPEADGGLGAPLCARGGGGYSCKVMS